MILLSSECEYVSRASASSDGYQPRIFRALVDLWFLFSLDMKIEININLEFSIMSQKIIVSNDIYGVVWVNVR